MYYCLCPAKVGCVQPDPPGLNFDDPRLLPPWRGSSSIFTRLCVREFIHRHLWLSTFRESVLPRCRMRAHSCHMDTDSLPTGDSGARAESGAFSDDAEAPARPMVLSLVGVPALLGSLRRVAAAADRLLVESTLANARQSWDQASAVVLDTNVTALCRAQLPRRSRVILLCDGQPALADWKAAALIGAEHVVSLPQDEDLLVTILGERMDRPADDGAVVAVVGACGGAGASTMAASIALESAGRDDAPATLLIDADHLGSGLDVLLGIENNPGLRWSGLTVEGGRISAVALRDALPDCGTRLRVLSCGSPPSRPKSHGPDSHGPTPTSMRAVIDAASREGEVVVCDVSRSPSPVSDYVLDRADLAVLVVPATVRACIAGQKVAAWVSRHNPNLGVVVRGPAPGGLTATDVEESLKLPLLASMRADRTLSRAVELRGLAPRGRSPLRAAARSVLGVLDGRPRGNGHAA